MKSPCLKMGKVFLDGKDVIGQARTGSGKTAAFALPMLQRIDEHVKRVQGLVLAPTRELALQITEEVRKLGAYTGVRVADLLVAARVDLVGAEGITVFAPDGYSIEYSVDDILKPFPKGRYYAGPAAFAGGRSPRA
jgi:CRISPR/Cas system-associated endonuclease/helicase Cas3